MNRATIKHEESKMRLILWIGITLFLGVLYQHWGISSGLSQKDMAKFLTWIGCYAFFLDLVKK